jgi:hypothetical protein
VRRSLVAKLRELGRAFVKLFPSSDWEVEGWDDRSSTTRILKIPIDQTNSHRPGQKPMGIA